LRLAKRVTKAALDRAEAHPSELWRYEVPHRVVKYRCYADARPWPGRSGARDRRALEAAYLTALMARSTTFGLAARTWGERAGMDKESANRASKSLETTHRAIRRATKGAPNIAARYRVRSAKRTSATVEQPPLGGPTVALRDILFVGVHLLDPTGTDRILLAHDAFRPAALGDAGWLITRSLSSHQAISPLELSKRTGVSAKRTDELLTTLGRYGAATRDGQSYTRAFDPLLFDALDRIAMDAGTLGDLERDRAKHQRQRAERDTQKVKPNALLVALETPTGAIV